MLHCPLLLFHQCLCWASTLVARFHPKEIEAGAGLPEALFAVRAFGPTKIVTNKGILPLKYRKRMYHDLTIDKDKCDLKCIPLRKITHINE